MTKEQEDHGNEESRIPPEGDWFKVVESRKGRFQGRERMSTQSVGPTTDVNG